MLFLGLDFSIAPTPKKIFSANALFLTGSYPLNLHCFKLHSSRAINAIISCTS